MTTVTEAERAQGYGFVVGAIFVAVVLGGGALHSCAVEASTKERAQTFCAQRCEVLDCHLDQTCDIRFPGRPAFKMDCGGKECPCP